MLWPSKTRAACRRSASCLSVWATAGGETSMIDISDKPVVIRLAMLVIFRQVLFIAFFPFILYCV
jgi:hypothetical protein